jgi:hypothetical protein
MVMCDEWVRILEEAVVAYLKALSRHYPRHEESHDKAIVSPVEMFWDVPCSFVEMTDFSEVFTASIIRGK